MGIKGPRPPDAFAYHYTLFHFASYRPEHPHLFDKTRVLVFVATGGVSRAIQVYRWMTIACCAIDAHTYQALLNDCLRHDDLDNAVRLASDALVRDPPSWLV